MATKERTGIIKSFRRGQHVVHDYVTIVEVEGDVDRAALVGARVDWKREDGFQIRGRVQSPHGNGRAVLVRWRKGFPPQGIGGRVTIRAE
ncbi:MAG: 50S ribosomal protein L35ae [Methanobacteriota archaeon]|nr:MAG: 50S ribosomal protein L35ae [Euryarchaeota archaeon]HTD80544.1 50S ribosomal protein L35ae [Thermoplasmata archaeon]